MPDVQALTGRFISAALIPIFFVGACSLAQPKAAADKTVLQTETPRESLIPIQPEGPADTVRAFYKHLREKKFKEAIFLTNLRPAVEGLTDTELKEFSLDFEALAGQVPADIEISGEIITNDLATVTANLPSPDSETNDIQTIKLKKANNVWVILTVDPSAEEQIKKEGKNYFHSLRIATHEDEARKMLERISKAQIVYSMQHGGTFGDVDSLVAAGFLPDDIKSSQSTGYNYAVELTADKRNYTATATPAAYGRSGKLSFLLHRDEKGVSRVSSRDIAGKVLSK
jgi:hypothetical protein